jgi:hypothetical protein
MWVKWGYFMRNNRTERFRHSALECLNMAKATTDVRARQTLLCMAEVWTKLLDQRGATSSTSGVDGLVDLLDTAPVPREVAQNAG